ncbi:MAG: hypothetical protein ACE5EW_02710 [Thermoplasmata archaeon]
MARARRQRTNRLRGFLVTWDVESRDASASARLKRYVYGYSLSNDGKTYRYTGLVDREGVRYVGQSVLFLGRSEMEELTSFLRNLGFQYVVTEAELGPVREL